MEEGKEAAGLAEGEGKEDGALVVSQGDIVLEFLVPVEGSAEREVIKRHETDLRTRSARCVSFSVSVSSVQSSQNVITESAAPETIVRSSSLTARAQIYW